MAKREKSGEVISTDVLIIGGGLSGLVAGIKAKEYPVDVLVVDRATVGWAGQATKAGNGLWLIGPDDDVDKFIEYHVRNIGEYLNDQELMYSYARDSYSAIEQLSEWGVQVSRDKRGKIGTFKHPAAPWSLTGVDLDLMVPLRKRALKAGVKLVNKVQVTDLLKQDDRVVGAVGFNLIDTGFCVFKAKSTIIATAGCNYKVGGMFNAYGDGIAAAYRAGAEIRNAEFGNVYDVVIKETGAPFYGGQNLICNAAGENISARYAPEAADVSSRLILGMEKEVLEGRGPLHVDLEQLDKIRETIGGKSREQPGILNGMVRLFPKKLEWMGRLMGKEMKYGPPPSLKPEVTCHFGGECSPIRVDHEMKTTIPGLWATGSASWQGSSWQGAVPPPGNVRGAGLMTALLSGLRAGPRAADFASGVAKVEVNSGEVKRLRKSMFVPTKRDSGISPAEVAGAIADVVVPVKYNLRRNKDRLEEALGKIEEVQERLPEVWVRDGHGLGKYHELKAMALCAELTFRSALRRTESRGSHFREDYPERDDKNWLKWIIAKDQGGKMVVSTEPVPIERYKVKPPNTP